MPVTTAQRAAELNSLIEQQAFVTRSMSYGWKPTDEEQAEITARADRLHELAELLGLGRQWDPPNVGRYLNDRIRDWIRANPLALTKRRVATLIEESPSNIDGQVSIQIGEPSKGGYYYQVVAADLEVVGGVLRFTVPESVAEYFRQQGIRSLQADLRGLLNVARA